MPRYKTFKYGRIAKYGRYNLGTTIKKAIGPHVMYRMRMIGLDGTRGEYITMFKERVECPAIGNVERCRIRINKGEWVYSQTDTIPADTYKVRIRSISSDGGMSDWVIGDRVNLKLI